MKRITAAIILLFLSTILLASTEYISVEADGLGTTTEEAVNNSLRNAISTAVGSLFRSWSSLDSYFENKGDDIIEETVFKEKILSFANAYVRDYEILESSEKDGMITVKIKADIKLQTLESSILRNATGFKNIDCAKLLSIFEANSETYRNGAEMVYAILKDFGFPKDIWSFSQTQTQIISTSGEIVKIAFDVTLKPDYEKYTGFLVQLEEILDEACGKTLVETINTVKYEEWDSILLSDFIKDGKFNHVIRIFKEKNGGVYTFKQYFLNFSNDLEIEIYEAFKKYEDDFSSYSMNVTFMDSLEKEIFKIKKYQNIEFESALKKFHSRFCKNKSKCKSIHSLSGNVESRSGKTQIIRK